VINFKYDNWDISCLKLPDKILLVDCKIKKKFLGIKPINIDMTIDNLDSLFGKPSKN